MYPATDPRDDESFDRWDDENDAMCEAAYQSEQEDKIIERWEAETAARRARGEPEPEPDTDLF